MPRKNRESQALQIIYEHWVEYGEYPASSDVALKMGIDINNFGGVRRRLLSKKKLVESKVWEFELSEEIIRDMSRNAALVAEVIDPGSQNTQNIVRKASNIQDIDPGYSSIDFTPMEMRVLGEVKAGKDGKPDELERYDGGAIETELFPNITPGREVYALRVSGLSMVHEEIFPGDFVLVEKATIMDIAEGGLIVANYLDRSYNEKNEEEISEAIQDQNNLFGPTLKYFRAKKRRDG